MPALPFTHEQFISVFAAYNLGMWPAQLVAYVLGLAVVLAIVRRSRLASVLVPSTLAVMWLWTGVAYHWLYFSSINKAALAFGASFVLQAALFGFAAVRRRVEPVPRNGGAGWGWALVCYALVLYPLAGLASGQAYRACRRSA